MSCRDIKLLKMTMGGRVKRGRRLSSFEFESGAPATLSASNVASIALQILIFSIESANSHKHAAVGQSLKTNADTN